MKNACLACGTTFYSQRTSGKFCSPTCKSNFNQKKTRRQERIDDLLQQMKDAEQALHILQKTYSQQQDTIQTLHQQEDQHQQQLEYWQAQLALDREAFDQAHGLSLTFPSSDHRSQSLRGISQHPPRQKRQSSPGWEHLLAIAGGAFLGMASIQQQKQLRQAFQQKLGTGQLAHRVYIVQRAHAEQELRALQEQLRELQVIRQALGQQHAQAVDVLDQLFQQHAPAKKQHSRKIPPISTSQTPSSVSSIGAADFLKLDFDTFTLSSPLGEYLGMLDRHGLCIGLVGDPGAGKSNFSLALAQLFDQQGFRILYYSLELMAGAVFKKNLSRYPCSNRMQIEPSGTIEHIRQQAALYDCIFVDSFNKLGCSANEIDALRKEFPQTIFLLIFQKNSDGSSKGGSQVEYDPSMVIDLKYDKTTDERWAYMKKSRYGTQGWTYHWSSNTLECPGSRIPAVKS